MICAVRCRVPIMLNKNDYISLPVAIIANLLWEPLCHSGLRYLSCFACLGPSMHNFVYELSTWFFFLLSFHSAIQSLAGTHTAYPTLCLHQPVIRHTDYTKCKLVSLIPSASAAVVVDAVAAAAGVATSIILALSYYTTHLFWHEHAPNGKKV